MEAFSMVGGGSSPSRAEGPHHGGSGEIPFRAACSCPRPRIFSGCQLGIFRWRVIGGRGAQVAQTDDACLGHVYGTCWNGQKV